MQEVHITKRQIQILEYPRLGKLYTALADQKKRGIALYVKDTIQTKLIYHDEEGRILIVEIMLNQKKVSLVVIYAPNEGQEKFYYRLHSIIREMGNENVCLMGDFNAIADQKWDYKSGKKRKGARRILPRSFFQMAEELNIYDVWRERCPEGKQYTFYSNRHESWSRIDMVWMSMELISEVKEIDIEPNLWADHNPMRIIWKKQKGSYRWLFNRTILKDQEYIKRVNQELRFFFKENRPGDTSIQNLWDTTKAFIRGVTISATARKKNIENQKIRELKERYRNLESELQKKPQNRSIKESMELIKHELAIFEKAKLAQSIKKAKQNFFENANKPGRWLSYRLKKQKQENWINKLQDEKGEICYQLEEKKRITQEFYEQLYRKNRDYTKEGILQYLEKSDLPKIPEETKDMLNEEIKTSEIIEAIQRQKNNKAAGPDGLPAEIYKEFQDMLVPTLLEVYNAVLKEAKTPLSWTEANIVLLPKVDTDQMFIQNYRPISLLNADYKIFALIIAERLKKFLTSFIHTDQNGFLPRRQIKNNMRIMLDILEYYEVHNEKQVALFFLDAQKAFDNVNWEFLHQQLEHMEFGDKFINTIRAIYTNQKAKVIINGELTQSIVIQKGTRQGCPLSPLLFILTLEVLARNVRKEEQIKGLEIKKEQFKLQAFADDLVFVLEDPIKSGMKLIEELTEYGKVAGLKINMTKTKMLVKNMTSKLKEELTKKLGIQTVKKVKYLGIHLSARCVSIKDDNYTNLINKTKRDLERWKNLQLSLMGRIAAIKMNVLPKFLFLFQNIPIKLEKGFFKDLNQLVSKFIWQGRKPRIKLKAMQDTKEKGGFGVPDWELYYTAATLTWLKEWITLRNKRLLKLEGHDLQAGWHAFLWYEKGSAHKYFNRHYIRQSLLLIWNKIKHDHYTKIPIWLSTMEAYIHPNLINMENIVTYKELLNRQGEIKTRLELASQGVQVEWWSYLQIQSRFAQDRKKEGIAEDYTTLDKLLIQTDNRLIKVLYRFCWNIS